MKNLHYKTDYTWSEIVSFILILTSSIFFSYLFFYESVCDFLNDACFLADKAVVTLGLGLTLLLWGILAFVRWVIEKLFL